MFDDDFGFGGNSMFDANHDGNLNAFERDNAECFLHDCDTYDQVLDKEGEINGTSPKVGQNNSGEHKPNWPKFWADLKFAIILVAIVTILGKLVGC